MKVLIGCEFSGTVRRAFRSKGHDAWSCDLLPAEDNGEHFQCNLLEVLDRGWDLAIFHPPCTYLTVSANKWLKDQQPLKSGALVGEARRIARAAAIDFFMKLANAPIERIAIENPIGVISSVWRKPDQTLQLWNFGHREMKSTCLWLKNLPKLTPTNVVGPPPKDPELRKSWETIFRAKPGPDRWKFRSKTRQGVAEAMARQWSN